MRRDRRERSGALVDLERLGAACLFAERLRAIAADGAWGASVRVQAVQALATCSDRPTEWLLIDLMGDERIGRYVATMLGSRAISTDGWSQLVSALDGDARARVCWILLRHPDRWSVRDIEHVVRLAAGGCREAVAALLSREHHVGDVIWRLAVGRDVELLSTPPMLALIAAAGVRRGEWRDVLERLATAGDGDVRQLAMQALAAQVGAAALPVLEPVFENGSTRGDRVAAFLAMIECGIDDAQLDGLLDRCATEDARDLGFALLSSRRGRPLTERARRFLAPLVDDEYAWVRFEVRALMAGSR